MSKFTSAIEKAQIDIVPKTVVNMGGQEQGSSVNAFEMLLGLLISEKLGVKFSSDSGEENAQALSLKQSIMESINQAVEAEKAATAKAQTKCLHLLKL